MLAKKKLQQAELELGMKTGFRVRVVENAGTALKRLFSSTNPWGSSECRRADCIVYSQGDEQVKDCRRRNILYENRCTACHVGRGKDEIRHSFNCDLVKCREKEGGIIGHPLLLYISSCWV